MSFKRWFAVGGIVAATGQVRAQTPAPAPVAPAPTTPGTVAPVWPPNRPWSGSVTPDTKVDTGTVRTVDPTHGVMICDMPDGQVTFDVNQAQVFDDAGKPLGAASALHPGDKVRVFYLINNGAKVSEVWVIPP